MKFRPKIATICSILYLIIIPLAHAASSPQYTIIIDAGSSGTRLHIVEFGDNNTSNSLPTIMDIAPPNTNVKPGISSYADHPEDAGPALKPLLEVAEKTLKDKGIDMSTVDFDLLGTAGMRLLPVEKQLDIYNAIKTYLTETTGFKLNHIATISGKMEGIYGWLMVNYLEKTLQSSEPVQTFGSLDMGGASTQITFASDTVPFFGDVYKFSLGGKQYKLFSHSFLYFGQDQARTLIGSLACYPKGYNVPGLGVGAFDYKSCQSAVTTYMTNAAVANFIPKLTASIKYIASSGYFYTMQFFNAKNPEQLEKAVNNVCANSWEDLQKQYPKVPSNYLANYCFNGTYINKLLAAGYRFAPDTQQIEAMNQIDETDIDWAMGYAIAQLIDEKAKETT